MFEVPEYRALMSTCLVQSDPSLANEINAILERNEKSVKKTDKSILETELYKLFAARFESSQLKELDQELRQKANGASLKYVLIELYKKCVMDCSIKGFLSNPGLNPQEFEGKQLDIRYLKDVGAINAKIKVAEFKDGKRTLVFHLKGKHVTEVRLSLAQGSVSKVAVKRTAFYCCSEYLNKSHSDGAKAIQFKKSSYTLDIPLESGDYIIQPSASRQKQGNTGEYPMAIDYVLSTGGRKCYTIILSFKNEQDERGMTYRSFAQPIEIIDHTKNNAVYRGNLSDLTDSKVYLVSESELTLKKEDVQSITIRQAPSGGDKEKSVLLRRLDKTRQRLLSQLRLEKGRKNIDWLWLLDDLITNSMRGISDSAVQRLVSELPEELYQLLEALLRIELALETGETLSNLLKQIVLDANYELIMGPQPQGLLIYETMKLLSDAFEHTASIEGKNAVFLLGNTGSGKSTLTNYLLGLRVLARKNAYGITVVELDGESSLSEGSYAKIGQSMTVSETTYVKGYPLREGDMVLADCPGFKDTRSSRYELATLLSIDQGVKAADKIGAIVLVLPYMSFFIDRASSVFELFQDLSSRVSGFLEDDQIRQSLFLVVTKALDTPEAEENFSAVIECFIEETRTRMDSVSPSDSSYPELKKRLDIWQLLGELYTQDRVIFPAIMHADTFNEEDNQYNRSRVLDKFRVSPGIPKEKFLPAMDNPRIQQQFGNYISVSIGNWRNLLVKPYMETLPQQIADLESSKANKQQEIQTSREDDRREAGQINELRQEITTMTQKANEIKAIASNQRGLDKTAATRLLQELNRDSHVYLNQQLEIEKERKRTEIIALERAIQDAESLRQQVSERRDRIHELRLKLTNDCQLLFRERIELGEGEDTKKLWEEKFDVNEPLMLRDWEAGGFENTFKNFGKRDNREGEYKSYDPKTYNGTISTVAVIDSEYRLVGKGIDGIFDNVNYANQSELSISWGNSTAKVNGNRYCPRPVEIGGRLYIGKASEDGRKVVYSFSTKWEGDGILPWIEVTHSASNSLFNEHIIDQKKGEETAKRKELIRTTQDLSTAEKELASANQNLFIKESELFQARKRLTQIEQSIESSVIQGITRDLKTLESNYQQKIQEKHAEIQTLTGKVKEREQKRSECEQVIIQIDNEIVEYKREKRRYAASIHAQWEVGGMLRTFAEQVTVGGTQQLGINTTRGSAQTRLNQECRDYVLDYDQKQQALKASLQKDLGSSLYFSPRVQNRQTSQNTNSNTGTNINLTKNIPLQSKKQFFKNLGRGKSTFFGRSNTNMTGGNEEDIFADSNQTNVPDLTTKPSSNTRTNINSTGRGRGRGRGRGT